MLRFLVRSVVLVALLLGAATCSLGPVWSPTLSGRVVDADSGEPVVAATVYASYRSHLVSLEQSSRYLDMRATETDANGRFRIPGHFVLAFQVLAWTDWQPTVRVFHPDYGMSIPAFRGWRPRIELRPDEMGLDRLTDTSDLHQLCTGISHEQCSELCRRIAGTEGPCVRL